MCKKCLKYNHLWQYCDKYESFIVPMVGECTGFEEEEEQ